MGANKWRRVAELEDRTFEGQMLIAGQLEHMHADLVAIRQHLGIGRAECAGEVDETASTERGDGQPRR